MTQQHVDLSKPAHPVADLNENGSKSEPPPSQAETDTLQSQPLPDYTKNWGPHLHRPAKLPDNYDTRIDPAHIFVFTVHPITGIQRDFYVTPKPCDYCSQVRQLCSRTRPHCSRCGAREEPRQCVFEEGWVRLPGPKCVKPKRQREESDTDARKKKRTKKTRITAMKSQQNNADQVPDAKLMQTEATSLLIRQSNGTAIAPGASPDRNALEGPLLASVSKLPTSHGTKIERAQATPTRAVNLVPPRDEADKDGELHRKRESGRYSLRQNPKRSAKVEA